MREKRGLFLFRLFLLLCASAPLRERMGLGVSAVAQARILVVEDDYAMSKLMEMALQQADFHTSLARSCKQARELLGSKEFGLILCDLYLGDGNGLELLKESRQLDLPPPFLMITAKGSVETAVETLREGAFDYLAKPFSTDQLIEQVQRALKAAQPLQDRVAAKAGSVDSLMTGSSPPMVKLYREIALAARSDCPVLVCGETGTGKELVAKALHRFSPRKEKPFVPVNCGSLTETLLEAELFGHERGAFTGASTARQGLFQSAQGGTLFLDEIADTTAGLQVHLLRALQDGEIRPLGSSSLIHVDTRIVAATNQDLKRLVDKGRFRQDLYYRLTVVQLEIPPLRARSEDIPQLASTFLSRAAERLGRPFEISKPALRLLGSYAWPGNVRELENAIERVAVLKTDRLIVASDLDFLGKASNAEDPPGLSELERVERRKIAAVLREAGGNKAEAARRLGIQRKTLYRKAQRLKIDLSG